MLYEVITQIVITRMQIRSNIEGKSRIPTFMPARILAVDPHFGDIIDRLKAQIYPPGQLLLVRFNLPLIPYVWVKRLLCDPTGLRLVHKWYLNRRITSYNVCYTKLLRKYCIIFARISPECLKQIADTVVHTIESELSLDITACISSTYQLGELTSALQELLRMSNYQYATHKVLTRITSYNVCYTKLLRP